MRKKHWLIAIVAVLALAVGIGGGTALAQENGNGAGKPIRGLITRVADILGLEEQQVQDAFDQARQEMRDERFEEMVGQRLEALVESGRITQEQADELREWYASRPDSFWLAGGHERGKKEGRARGQKFDGRGHMFQGRGGFPAMGQMGMSPELIEKQLDQHLDALVEGGQLTEEQAGEIRERFAAQTERFHRRGGFERGKGHGWQWSRQHSIQRGYFHYRGLAPDRDKAVPAAPAEVSPTAEPADSDDGGDSDDNDDDDN